MKKICLLLSILTGCGYTLAGSGSVLPEDVKTIAVINVINKTTEPGLGPRFTEELRSRFERYGVVKVVDNPAEADAQLKARITEVSASVRNVTGDTDVEVDNDLALTVSAELVKKNGQVLWRNPALRITQSVAGTGSTVVTSSSSFLASGVSASSIGNLSAREVQRGQREQVIDAILEEAARQIYMDAVASDF